MKLKNHNRKNPVAKNLPIFNKPKVFVDKKKEINKVGYKEDGKEDNTERT